MSVIGFEKYGIKSVSPTMIANWDAAPATLILKRVFGVKFQPNAKMWRGDAVEAGLAVLLRTGDLANAVALAQETFLDRSMGEVSEETEKEAALIEPMLERLSEYVSEVSPPQVMASQLAVEGWFDGISAPFYGKMDFVFLDKTIWELKTTERAPSKLETATLSHRWQAAVYAEFRQAPVTLLYVTAKKVVPLTVLPGDESLKSLKQSAKAMDRMLNAHDEGLDLLASLPLAAGSFYWDDEMISAYEQAIEGTLPPLKGTGTEALLARGVITFGKHAGKHISDVPDTYLNWLLNPKLSDGGTYDVPEALQEAIKAYREAA